MNQPTIQNLGILETAHAAELKTKVEDDQVEQDEG